MMAAAEAAAGAREPVRRRPSGELATARAQPPASRERRARTYAHDRVSRCWRRAHARPSPRPPRALAITPPREEEAGSTWGDVTGPAGGQGRGRAQVSRGLGRAGGFGLQTATELLLSNHGLNSVGKDLRDHRVQPVAEHITAAIRSWQ